MWKYVQETGQMFQNTTLIDAGYSGSKVGKNNPAMECEKNVGPIPRGYYTIQGQVSKPTAVTLPLSADDPDYCKPPRDGFLIHGDNSSGTASTGCIVLKRSTRERIRDSGDTRLQVVATSVLTRRRKVRPAKHTERRRASGRKR